MPRIGVARSSNLASSLSLHTLAASLRCLALPNNFQLRLGCLRLSLEAAPSRPMKLWPSPSSSCIQPLSDSDCHQLILFIISIDVGRRCNSGAAAWSTPWNPLSSGRSYDRLQGPEVEVLHGFWSWVFCRVVREFLSFWCWQVCWWLLTKGVFVRRLVVFLPSFIFRIFDFLVILSCSGFGEFAVGLAPGAVGAPFCSTVAEMRLALLLTHIIDFPG